MGIIEDIFEEYEMNRDKLEVSIEDMKKDIADYSAKILLYGAGSAGIAFLYDLRRIGIEPLFFVDSDERKIGTKCEGISIITPGQVKEKAGEDALIIVCINTDGKRYCKSFDEALRRGGHHAVYDKLKEAGCKNIIDYTYFRRCHKLFTEEKYNAPSCSDVDLMIQHQKEIVWVYERLADELSKEIFEKILRFRMLDDTLTIPTMPQDKQYFEYGFYERRENEVFIDCGAFNGISLKTFLRENGNQFAQYYGMEPDADNYVRLKEYIDTLPIELQKKIIITDKAAWKDNAGTNLYALHGPGSFIADIGPQPIQTITIDELMTGQKATYIKMNIEGSEKEALQGAERTICEYKPRLAIAGYHRTEDLWKIPQMIFTFKSDYQLYLRSYMNHISFVYYLV